MVPVAAVLGCSVVREGGWEPGPASLPGSGRLQVSQHSEPDLVLLSTK